MDASKRAAAVILETSPDSKNVFNHQVPLNVLNNGTILHQTFTQNRNGKTVIFLIPGNSCIFIWNCLCDVTTNHLSYNQTSCKQKTKKKILFESQENI